jgi:hypothetical protein
VTTSTGKWLDVHGGVTYFAKVSVDAAAEARVEVLRRAPSEPHDSDAVGVPATGYDQWISGALLGVEFALGFIRTKPVSVIIQRIIGTIVDTTVGAVTAAAAIAVWTALEYTPPRDATERLKRCALETRDSPGRVRELLLPGQG